MRLTLGVVTGHGEQLLARCPVNLGLVHVLPLADERERLGEHGEPFLGPARLPQGTGEQSAVERAQGLVSGAPKIGKALSHAGNAGRDLSLPDEGCALLCDTPSVKMSKVVLRPKRDQFVRQSPNQAPLPTVLVNLAREVECQTYRDRMCLLPRAIESFSRNLQGRIGIPEH